MAPVGKALELVLAERVRQDARWGEQNHDPFTWNAILMEEVGEWQKEALTMRFNAVKANALDMRVEAVRVAAVALAIVECIDRGKWRWPRERSGANRAKGASVNGRRCSKG